MHTCPACRKPLERLRSECPYCKADLSLLVEYVGNLEDSLHMARELTRSGELDQAVWAYLEILEVDPDNREARRQVSKVVTAVRQFDRLAARRWLKRLRAQKRGFASSEPGELSGWNNLIWLLIVVAAFFVGWFLRY